MAQNPTGFFRRVIGRMMGSGLSRVWGMQTSEAQSRVSQSPATVNFDTAMQLSAVWACARIICETIASQPIHFWLVDEDGRRPDDQSGLPELFRGKVNRYQTLPEFLETFLLNLVLHGNAFALKQRDGAGDLIGLLPLMSTQVEVEVLRDGSVVYFYHNNGEIVPISEEHMLHCKLFGNGVIGLSPLSYARNTIGIGIAGESQVASIFADGGKPTGVLMSDNLLNAKQREQLREEFRGLREGQRNQLAVLEAGFKYQQVSMSPQDIQLLESRRFQIEDIARFFGVPSVLINDTSAGTTWGSGIQQLVQGFYKMTLRPYTARLSESFRLQLLEPSNTRDILQVEFDFSDLVNGDFHQRVQSYSQAINASWMTPNEVRLREGLPTHEDGDELMANGNMAFIEDLGRAISENQATPV